MIMFISGGVLSYIVNSIGNVLHNIYKTKNQYNKTLNVINSYMIKNKVNVDLQIRIRSYI